MILKLCLTLGKATNGIDKELSTGAIASNFELGKGATINANGDHLTEVTLG